VSPVWLKPWRAKTPTLLWLPQPKMKIYEADASFSYPQEENDEHKQE